MKDSTIPDIKLTAEQQVKMIFSDIEARKKDAEDKHQIRDIGLYRRYFKIWDLRKSGKSWAQINNSLKDEKVKSIKGVKNAYESINQWIEKGVPGFKPFPAK